MLSRRTPQRVLSVFPPFPATSPKDAVSLALTVVDSSPLIPFELIRLPPADDDTLWRELLEQLKPSSRTTYTSRLRQFAASLGHPMELLPAIVVGNDAPTFTTAVIRYRNQMKSSGLAPSTMNVTLTAISWLVSALHEMERITWTLKVRGFKAMKYRDTAGPDEQSVRAMLDVLHKTTSYPLKAARDEVLVRLAVSMGLRRSEIVQLDIDDVVIGDDVTPTRVAVLGKGCDEKAWLTVPSRTARALQQWLAHRSTIACAPHRCVDSRGVESERIPLFVRCTHAAHELRRATQRRRVRTDA